MFSSCGVRPARPSTGNNVGLGDGLLGGAPIVHDAVLGHGVEAGGIDDQIIAVADAADTVVAVWVKAGLIG